MKCKDLIKEEKYHTFEDIGLTVCCLVCHNGFKVVGSFSEPFGELGEHKIKAKKEAVRKLNAIRSYLLHDEV